MKEKLATAAVVFVGIIALTLAGKYGANPEWVAAGGSVLLLLAGTLRSMILPETKKEDPRP
jgi:hypothetical protein